MRVPIQTPNFPLFFQKPLRSRLRDELAVSGLYLRCVCVRACVCVCVRVFSLPLSVCYVCSLLLFSFCVKKQRSTLFPPPPHPPRSPYLFPA